MFGRAASSISCLCLFRSHTMAPPPGLFSHPPPGLRDVKSRTDCQLDTEAAAIARTTFRENSEKRRKDEAKRIAKANQENKQRLSAVKDKTDSGDGTVNVNADGIVLSGAENPYSQTVRLRLQGCKDFREKWAEVYDKKVLPLHQDHIKRLPTITSSIDDDTEDDATGEARARLREESETRRRAEAQELRERNKEYRAALSSVTSLTDSKIWDDGEGSAGAMRSVVATRSQARKAEEAKQLAAENEENRSRLSRVTSRTDDGD